ncbi:MAG: metalloprotease TldD [Acidobacteria bacterium]|nr:metalloprotease TldD [Acidobacteriota bacterium]
MSARELFERQHGLDSRQLGRVLSEALGGGGDFADVYLEYRQSSSLHLEESLLKESSEAVALGAGVRVVAGEQTGYAYTNELSLEKLLECARTAASIAAGAARSGSIHLAPRAVPARYPAGRPAHQSAMSEKTEFLRAADAAARRADSRVREVSANWSDEWRQILIANSDGELVADSQPLFAFGVSVVIEADGNPSGKSLGASRQAGWKNLGLRAGLEAFSGEKAEGLAREAVAQAATLLTAADAPAGELPIVLAAGASGVLLHESVGHPLEADANRKRLSVFSGRLGERVATELCTVVDDATLPGLRGSLNVDGEGTIPRAATVLIEQGVLRAYLQDRLSARLMKMAPTGNGRRAGYTSIPIPRMTNTYLAAGESDPEDIIRSVERGLYCKAFSGGQVEPAVGKFTFSVHEAYLIENGRITRPVKGATLIGSGVDILENIVAVGHDLELDRGAWACGKEGQSAPVGVGTPTVKITRMTVGGRR